MIFITGFPGFLATELLTQKFKKDKHAQVTCLVQSKFLGLANSMREQLTQQLDLASDQIQLVEGDITLPGLALPPQFQSTQIQTLFHFAAVYDLSVSKALGELINIKGTRNVLEFAKKLPHLRAFHYVSTCYVSGCYDGVFLEDDLEKGQTFNNFYESTKYEAEKLVRAAMTSGLPATIYRPAIVVGNSQTGATLKYDGPYFVIQWLLRQGKHAILPKLSNPAHYKINFVPSNFVVDAIGFLSDQPSSIGKTFQLADPAPRSISEVLDTLAAATERSLVTFPVPRSLAKFAVRSIPGLENWLGIPAASLDYFVHPTTYDVSETTKALQSSGIKCPSFCDYSKALVDFMKNNPSLRNHALR